jgi:inosose dehydratase
MIRIGANPICWSNDDMIEIGGNISLEQCLSEARDIGLEGMEKGNKFPTTARALKAKLAEFGLVFISGWYSTFLLERDADAEFAAARGRSEAAQGRRRGSSRVCECTRTVHGDKSAPLSTRPVLTDAEWSIFLPRMTRFAELVKGFGLQLVYHHHMGTVVQTPAEVDRFMAGDRTGGEAPAAGFTVGGSMPQQLCQLRRVAANGAILIRQKSYLRQ